MKRIKFILSVVVVFALVACKGNQPEKSEFDKQMDRAMASSVRRLKKWQ